MTAETRERGRMIVYLLLASFMMAHGWGYRGTVGHEPGAMVPGALLGLVLCLGSGRRDWYGRAAVAGLFAAVGWAWGGSLSYMEHTLYVLSDSTWDVLYGYSILFFLGALWAGVGGGVLGLALTEPRSELERLVRPFTLVCAAFLVTYLYFFFRPGEAEAFETLTVRSFHDTAWLAAGVTVIVSGVYWVLRPSDRLATALLFRAGAAWWAGYLCFTKVGGLRLAPLHRSEGWGGIVGVLVVVIVYLVKRRNRAALMLCLYGILGGGLAFALAVFIRHPMVVHWGPFKGAWPQWRTAEVCFGFFMGLALALGTRRLICGGLAPPQEDRPRAPLDAYAVFVMLIAVSWINFRRHVAPWLATSDALDAAPFLGVPAMGWFVIGGVLATGPVVYVLFRYLRGDRQLVPASAFGKGAGVCLGLVGLTLAGYTLHDVPSAGSMPGHLLLWVPAAVGTWLLLSCSSRAAGAAVPCGAVAGASDQKWKVGVGYWLTWIPVPLFLLAITALSTGMQDGPLEGMGRKRFGADAYWRQTARLVGMWRALYLSTDLADSETRAGDLPISRLAFDEYRNVAAVVPSGERVEAHRWSLMNQFIWLDWYGKVDDHPDRARVPLQFQGERLYIAWPPKMQKEGYLVFERATE